MNLPKIQTDFKNFPEITTERLVLRKVTKKDVNEMFILRSDERMMTYVGRPRCKNNGEALEFIKKILGEQKKEQSINWAITLKGDPLLKGNICLWRINKDHYRAEIGYALHPDLWGKGIMLEAVKAVVGYGFNSMNLHSIEGHTKPDNVASVNVLTRAGFKKEAYFRENFFFDGKFSDTFVFSLLASDFNSKK
ncbi:MAG: family N-acetyltransferase [Bacteroidetes bacterium]|jgi:ribosomal-protein-alanine N-acetyltransferase|nr:family N-acetyltransferase [Bacteroidota bacterium]